MKKATNRKKWPYVVGSIVAAILIVIVVLCCVPTSAYVKIDATKVDSIQIMSGSATYAWSGARDENTQELTTDEEFSAFSKQYSKAANFTVMHGIMSTLWAPSVKATEAEPKNVAAIKALSGDTVVNMVVVSYSEMLTQKIGKEEIKYDYLVFFVKDNGKQLSTFSFYLLDGSKVRAEDPAYAAQEYKGWMTSKTLKDYINDL